MADGEIEFALVEAGESISADEDSRLLADVYEWLLPSILGLSLPVGPFPSEGLLAGGKFIAARSALFSSSNSATLCSNAYKGILSERDILRGIKFEILRKLFTCK